MRYFRVLNIFLVAAVLSSWLGIASAQTVTRDTYYAAGYGGVSYYAADPTTVCSEVTAKAAAANSRVLVSFNATTPGSTSGFCQYTYQLANGSTSAFTSAGPWNKLTCGTTTPFFNSITKKCEGERVEPQTCVASSDLHSVSWAVGKTMDGVGGTVDYDPFTKGGIDGAGCKVEAVDITRCWNDVRKPFPREIICTYSVKRTGGKGTGGEPNPFADTATDADKKRQDVPPVSSPSGTCPKGTVAGGSDFSGNPVCVGTGTDPKNTPAAPPKSETEKTVTDAEGTKTTTKTEITKNADGSSTTVTTVTIVKADGTKDVSQDKQVSKTPTGTAGKDDSNKDDEKYDLCKQNPNLAICKNSSVSGKCGQISCMGDAIQCATLRAAAAMQCQQEKEITDLGQAPGLDLGKQIAAGTDPRQGEIDTWLKGNEVDMSKTQLDSSGFLGAGSCFAPMSFTAMGQQVSVSFDKVCENIQPLRYAVMACAFILVYLTVSRSVLQG